MFEREIKFIYDFNLNKISRLGPYFTFEQLASTEIHPAILHYISAEIDYLIFEDRQNLLKNSAFDYSGEKISYHFTQITEELKKTKRFAVEYVAKLILHASSFTINYLARPKWTLTRFVFDEEKHKSTNEIKQILNYVYYYKYLTKILVSYINTKKILSMNIGEFETLLNKADSIGVENYLPAILTNSLKSMAEFFNIGELKKHRIPLPAVELFVEEKELFNHLKALNDTLGSDENARFNFADYLKVLSHVMIEKEEVPPVEKEEDEFETKEISAQKRVEPKEEIVEEEPERETLTEEPVSAGKEKEYVEESPVEEEHEVDDLSDAGKVENTAAAETPPANKYENDMPIIVVKEKADTPEDESDSEPGEEYKIEIPFRPEGMSFIKEEEGLNIEELIEPSEGVDDETEDAETTEEITSPPDEDVVIKTPRKFRIRMKDESEVEPIYDDEEDIPKSKGEKKLDLFGDYGSFSEGIVEEDEEEKKEAAPFGYEENSLWADESETETIEQAENLGIQEPETHEENSGKGAPINTEPEAGNETEPETSEESSVTESEDAPDFRSIMEEQQNLLTAAEEENKTDKELGYDDYESDASKKLDERITEEKNDADKESMFDVIKQNSTEDNEETRKVDLAELLERKEMTKIIEVIFDYDIEDFAAILDEIATCRNVDDAHLVINQVLVDRHINRNSKEAETFRSIITQYFRNS